MDSCISKTHVYFPAVAPPLADALCGVKAVVVDATNPGNRNAPVTPTIDVTVFSNNSLLTDDDDDDDSFCSANATCALLLLPAANRGLLNASTTAGIPDDARNIKNPTSDTRFMVKEYR